MLIRGFEPRLVGLNLLIKATMAPKLFCGRQFTDSGSFLLKEIKLNRLLKMLIVWSSDCPTFQQTVNWQVTRKHPSHHDYNNI